MKALKGQQRPQRRTNRRGSQGEGEGLNASDSSGFNAKKTLKKPPREGARNIKLNTKPYGATSAPTRKGSTETPKKPLSNLRASLNRVNQRTPRLASGVPSSGESVRGLMDDQSVASFYTKDSRKSSLASSKLSSSPGSGWDRPKIQRLPVNDRLRMRSTSIQSEGQRSQVSQASAGSASTNTKTTTTEPIDMFDDFANARSSGGNGTRHDPFENKDAFASHSFLQPVPKKPPAVERASVIDEDQSSVHSENSGNMSSDISGKKRKKSKMQKIGELLNEKKAWREEKREFRKEIRDQSKRIEELEEMVEDAGSIGTRAEILRSVAEQDEELKKTKKELAKAQAEAKSTKKQITSKKGEMLTMEKALDAHASEISTLRKELSQALQQVDMLEEEQEEDKQKILKLTNSVSRSRDGSDDASGDVSDMKEQLELYEREIKKKDRQVESQRIEVQDQIDQILRLKSDLEKSENKGRDLDDTQDRVVELKEINDELQYQLENKAKDLSEMEEKQAEIIKEQATELMLSERRRKQLMDELEESQKEVDGLKEQLEKPSENSHVSESNQAEVDSLRADIEAVNAAYAASEKKYTNLVSENDKIEAENVEKMGKLAEQNMELQSKLAQMNPRAETLESAVDQLREDIKMLEDSNRELEVKLQNEQKESEKRVSALNGQVTNLRSSLQASQGLHQQSEDDALKGVSELQAKLAETEMALEEMKLYNEELESSAEELRETSADFEQDILGLQEERDELQQKLTDLDQDLAAAGEMIETMEELQNRLVETQEQAFVLSERNQSLESHVLEIEEENEYLKENLDEVQNDASEAQQAVTALEELMDEYDDLQEDSHALKEKVTGLESELERVKAECEEWHTAADNAEKQVAESAERILVAEATGKNLDTLQLESDEIRQQNGNIQRKLDEAVAERDRWKEAANDADADAAAKQAAISSLKESNNEFSAFEVEAAELRAIRTANEAKIAALTQDRDDIKASLEEAEGELENARSAVSSLEELMEEFEVLQDDADGLRQDNAELESQIEMFTQELAESKNSVLRLTSELDEATASVAEFEATNKQLEDESGELQLKNANLVFEVAELQAENSQMKKQALDGGTALAENERALIELSDFQTRVHEAESTAAEANTTKDELMLQLETSTRECDRLREASMQTELELTESKQLVTTMQGQLEDYEQVQKDLTNAKSDIESEMGLARDRAEVSSPTMLQFVRIVVSSNRFSFE